MVWALLVWVVYRIIKFRKLVPIETKLVLVTTTVLSLLYTMLFYEAFKHHDYYMINLFILPLLLLVVYLKHEPLLQQTIGSKAIMFGLVIVSVYSMFYTHKQQTDRYQGSMKEYAAEGLYTITPYLRSIGVERTDIVVSVPDNSPNVSLYLMNNFGWTEAFNGPSYNIDHFYDKGAKYLIVSDSSYINMPLYKPYVGEQVGSYQGIYIYKLQ